MATKCFLWKGGLVDLMCCLHCHESGKNYFDLIVDYIKSKRVWDAIQRLIDGNAQALSMSN